MAYKPPRVDMSGPQGNATVKLGKMDGKNAVRIEFEDGKTYTVSPKKCPEYVQAGYFYVAMTSEKDGIKRMQPISGKFKGKVVRFSAQEGKPPVPRTKNVTLPDGQSYSYQFFVVWIEIAHPEKYKGMEVSLNLRYHFGESAEIIGGKQANVVAINHLKSKYTGLLDEFLVATGVWDKGPMEYSDNILPKLQRRILTNDRSFEFTMKDGWVQYITVPDPNEALEKNNDWDEPGEDLKSEEPISDSDLGLSDNWGDAYVDDKEEKDDTLPWEEVE